MDDRVKEWATKRLEMLTADHLRHKAMQILFNELTSGKIAEYRHKNRLDLGIDFVGLFKPGKKKSYYFKV